MMKISTACLTAVCLNSFKLTQVLILFLFQVAFMPYRVNGQYIMEGLASSFLFTIGGLGIVMLDQTNKPSTPKLNRILLLAVAGVCILVSFFTCRVFMRMKLP